MEQGFRASMNWLHTWAGVVLGGFATLDIAVHGWDLARATGQEPAVGDTLAETVLAFAR